MNSSSPKRRRPVVASTNGRCYGSLLGGLKSGDPSFGPELTPLLSIEALFQSTPGSEEPGDPDDPAPLRGLLIKSQPGSANDNGHGRWQAHNCRNEQPNLHPLTSSSDPGNLQ